MRSAASIFADPIMFDADHERTIEAIELAAEVARADKGMLGVRRSDAVWYALREAMETLRRLPDREAGWLYCQRSLWPEFAHDHEDKVEAYATMLERVKIGELPVEALAPRRPPVSPKAVSRMELVFGWNAYVVSKYRRRDWRILCMSANGTPAGSVARISHCSKRTVYDRRELQTAAIARGLLGRYPDVFPNDLIA
ncbi:hypothetical protein [Microbaculum marinum]|uniref:Uncharacterized protein n=1 Tax=Microbaculum marinum TaxID=1764581 RepID=A0AAW9RCD2_9HYPH